jgi:hypothetical protein
VSARRDWYAVQCRLIRLPKFRRLSDAAQLALFYVWALAADADPEATWPSLETLAEALALHGRDPVPLDELAARGWIDALEDGRVAVHDWDQWQFAASHEIKKAWEANRVRTWRAAKRDAVSPTPPLQDSHSTTQDITGVRTPYVGVRTPPDGALEWGHDWDTFLEVWTKRYRLPPTDFQTRALWPIIDARPSDAADWLRSAPPGSAFDTIGYVLRCWDECRAVVPLDPPPIRRTHGTTDGLERIAFEATA